MPDTPRAEKSSLAILRSTLARLGYEKVSSMSEGDERWTLLTGRLAVTIHATSASGPAAPKDVGIPPGASVI